MNMDGKVAVVTGGSRGLGKAMCEAFAAHGATVVIASRKEDACVELAEAITKETGREALGIGCHVGRWDDNTRLFDTVVERFGKIDVLVNNAGMSPLYPSLPEVSEELFDKVVGVNMKGPFRLAALTGAHMQANGGGSIIFVSSIAAVEPSPRELPYGMAKAGLHAMTAGMAHAFGPTVRVNTIMPGPFLTDISKAWDLDAFETTAKLTIPLQRGGRPEEIVGAALYLATDASSYTTGAVIKIDGGAAWARG